MTREDVLKLYDEVVSNCSRFDRKGKTMPYTSANGHMFSQLNKDGELGIRFSKDLQMVYMEKLETTYFKSYGAIMKGYVLMPEVILNNSDELKYYLNKSYDYVMTLEPK